MSKIFVSTPAANGLVHQKTIISTRTITFEHELDIKYIENCSLIPKGRQDHHAMFLRSDCDYMISIDADMLVGPPGILDLMIKECPENSIIGGLYAMKALTPDGIAPVNGTPLNGNITKLDGSLLEMRYIPTGFMLISKAVAQKMADQYKHLNYVDNVIGDACALYNCILQPDETGVTRFLPEDFSYCTRARAIGIKIYAHTAAMLGHIGSYLYHVEHLRK